MERFESQSSDEDSIESRSEKENFEPEIVFDFIRHGKNIYGTEAKGRVEQMGYKWEDVVGASDTKEGLGERASIEGKLTPEGREQLHEAFEDLSQRIDQDNEVILLLYSPQLRAEESAGILLDELEETGVNVYGAREHLDLLETKANWLAVLEFIKEKSGGEGNPYHHWLKMSDRELEDAGLEGMGAIGNRLDHFIKLIQTFARFKRKSLGLDSKRLRVVAVTHGLNINALLKRQGVPDEKLGPVKNAQIVELGVNQAGESRLLDKES